MAQCSGYSDYHKIYESNKVEREMSDPVLASSPAARPLVVVGKSPLSPWSPGNKPE
ncbi:hypothetical protein J6590_088273 [Homalodisca vitripennis]|nr:hypothetical protein J6590_088273 [Homalodisca vitripennis]